MIKETNKTLMINVENKISIGNDAVEAIVIHQICLYKGKDGVINADVDYVDITGVTFMGIKIGDSYTEFNKLKDQLKEWGVDLNALIDEECVGLFHEKDLAKIKDKYKNIF